MPKTFLVVDDEAHIVRLVETNLTKYWPDCRVLKAYNGNEALQRVAETPTDLIILDVMMPPPDGFEVLKRLQADEATVDIPVLMLTARAQDQDIFHGWQMGCSAYLTKPFNPRELLTFVERILASQQEEGKVTVGDYGRVNTGRVTEDGEIVWEV